jgi:hypothetical protein
MSKVDEVLEFAFKNAIADPEAIVVVDDSIWHELQCEMREMAPRYNADPATNEIRLAAHKVIPCHFPIRGMFCVPASVWKKVAGSMAMMIFTVPGVTIPNDWQWRAHGMSDPERKKP